MDLFTVDSWTSDRDTDDLNSRLFGKNKAPRRGTFETSRKKPSNATARKQDRTVLGEQTGRNQKRKRRLSEDTTNSTGGQQATQELKRKKRPLASSSRKSEAQETPLGESCVATNEESTGKAGKGVLKRKRKKSSKKNKYKHLDEMHRLQNESVSGPSKLDIDSSVKVNANCLKSKVKEPENSDPAAVTAPDLFSCPKAKRIKSGKQKMPQKSDSSHKRKKSSSVENEADRVNKQKVNNPNEDNYENNKSEKGHKSPKKTSFDTHSLKAALNKEQPTLSDVSTKSKKKVVSLREKMEEKLTAARFRFLNQQLYTISGGEALKLMQEDQSAFTVYHQGFQQQVNKWPQNPVGRMIAYIKKRPGHTVADFGCGDAKIAQSVSNKVHSFDLVALNEFVTPCDMAHVSLQAESVDIAVFCLSLMGTNLGDFLAEAHRVLKKGGNLLVAEVASRFTSVKKFLRKLERMGFTLLSQDPQNKMFLWFELKKTGDLKDKLPEFDLAPCFYKKR